MNVKKNDGIKLSATSVFTNAYSKALDPLVRRYIDTALGDRTRQEYRADLKRFLAWGGQVPAEPVLSVTHLTEHAETYAMATLQRWLSQYRMGTYLTGFRQPRQNETGENRPPKYLPSARPAPTQVEPTLSDDLAKRLRDLDDSPKAAHDWALLRLGFAKFYVALRRSDLVAL